ncbi:unnamed protein product [Arabis nemorensis]|uniref:CCHC-type domain-containing protein n=1 Tax=Arabis nemorensis TaxID=586526 RepID=A0A565CFV0_9BRAS|nr:unnamed protein product [Arabis nemorensis]
MFDNSSSHRLVGKFFTNSTPPSFEETEKSLRQQWNLSGDMIVQKQGDNDTFLFEFRQKNDKVRVLDNLPFNVNGVILVIKDPNSSSMIDFTVATLVVFVVGLPWCLSTKEYLPTLESLIGGNATDITFTDGLFCFFVEVDLKKPLKAGFYIEENQFVEFKYSQLGDFCYKCGMIDHVETSCDRVRVHKERALNATSRTHVYGPWLRDSFSEKCFELVLNKSQNGARECEKSLSYAQFFIELEFNNVFICNPKFESRTKSTHRFRFPCSYLDTETEHTDFTTSKAYKVIRDEIYENTPFSDLAEFFGNRGEIGSLVEQLKLTKKNEFCCDDMWLVLNLQINRTTMLMPADR